MSNSKTTKARAVKISEFDVKTIIFPEEFRSYKNNKFIQKSLAINVKGKEEGDDPVPLAIYSLEPRFSFGLKGFSKGEWSMHTTFGPTRESKPETKEYKLLTKELNAMKAIQKALKKRVSSEIKDKDFLFLRETEDEENGKEYSTYLKVVPGQTRVRIGKTSYKTEKDLRKLEGRAIDVCGIGIEFDKISICPKVVSVKPRLGFILGEFRTSDDLQDWDDLFGIAEDEESEEEENEQD